MIVDLPATTIDAVVTRQLSLRDDVGAMALSRVLTLVVLTPGTRTEDALKVANQATRQHPSRIVCVATGNARRSTRIDAQIRVGGDAGASEIVVLRLVGELADQAASVVLPLLLADSPIVAWWPFAAPADVSSDPIGLLADRRITDAQHAGHPPRQLRVWADHYHPGDTDLAWTRTTRWRGLLAAALDQPPYEPVTSAAVVGATESASTDLLAGWLAARLACPVHRARTVRGTGLVSVRLSRASGQIDLVRPAGDLALLSQPGQPPRRIALPRRGDAECLADELARLDADEVYQEVLVSGLAAVRPRRQLTAVEALRRSLIPSVEAAECVLGRHRRAEPRPVLGTTS